MNKAARILFKKAKKFESLGQNVDAISAYEDALKHSPQNPDILFAIGNVARNIDMLPIAEQMFRTVYGLLPDSIEAATNLAVVIDQQERTEEAIEIYKSLLAQHPEHVGTWVNIGNTVAATDDLETAEIFYREALRLKPGSIEALTNISELFTKRGDFKDALDFITKAVKRDKRNPLIRYNRGEILLALGQLEEGWAELEYGTLNRKDRQIRYHHKIKRWRGDTLKGKTILLSCEQGIGDQVRYLSCVEDIIQLADKVIIETEPRLVDILARTYPEVTVKSLSCERIANVMHVHYDWAVNECDYHCSMLGLYGYFKTDLTMFERPSRLFVTDEALDLKWKENVSNHTCGFNVGICWRSGKKALSRNRYYTRIEDWKPVLTQKNATFFNLMYDECDEEVKYAKDTFGADLISFEGLDYKDDIDDLFSLTKHMDLVISVNSAPASFSGVLGVETIMPARSIGWDMLGTDHMAMVPSMRSVIQKEQGDWAPVMEEISELLAARLV